MLWEECAAVGMPRAVVATKLDAARADYDEALIAAQSVFGDGVMPLYLPMLADDDSVGGLIALLSSAHRRLQRGKRVEREAEPQHMELIDPARDALIEAIIAESEDETLMDRYLSGEEVELDTLIDDLEKAVARGSFYPVIPVCGVQRTWGIAGGARSDDPRLPQPRSSTRSPRSQHRMASRKGRSTADPAGHSSLRWSRPSPTRMWAGSGWCACSPARCGLTPPCTSAGMAWRIAGHEDHDVDERIGALSSPLGKAQRSMPKAIAGDICAVAKLTRAETGDTLSDKETPLLDAGLGNARAAACRWRSWRTARPTRTSSRRGSADSSPRTRP